jgi:hypothetical protein
VPAPEKAKKDTAPKAKPAPLSTSPVATVPAPKPGPVTKSTDLPTAGQLAEEASPEFKQKMADLEERYQSLPGGGPEPTAEPDRAPTTPEKKKFGEHLKTFKVDNAALKAWILKFTGAESIGKMTKGQYEKVIAKLDAVTELGQAALDSLVNAKEA